MVAWPAAAQAAEFLPQDCDAALVSQYCQAMPFFPYNWAALVFTLTMKRFLLIFATIAVVLYGLDFLSLELRIPRREKLGSVTMHTYYVVKLKSGKTEYDYAGDHDEDCSNSAFPQLGVKPCWYATRHTEQQIIIDSGSPNNPHIF